MGATIGSDSPNVIVWHVPACTVRKEGNAWMPVAVTKGSEGGGGGGKGGGGLLGEVITTRGPQSVQSLPSWQVSSVEPCPPSSHMPFE